MITNEQRAHDLAMVYISNRYGINIVGDMSISSFGETITGTGEIETEHLPSTKEIKTKTVRTGEKSWLGIDKTKNVMDGYVIDSIFQEMVSDYLSAYKKFLKLLEDNHF